MELSWYESPEPDVAAARVHMMDAARAWQAVAPVDGEADPLTDDQLKLLVDALAAQRDYLEAASVAREARVICLP